MWTSGRCRCALCRARKHADPVVVVRTGKGDATDLLAGRIAWAGQEDAAHIGAATAWTAVQGAAEDRSIADKARPAAIGRVVDLDGRVAAPLAEVPGVLIDAADRTAVDDGEHRSIVGRGRPLLVEGAELVDRRDDAVGTDVELAEVEAAQRELAAQEQIEERVPRRRRRWLRRLGLRRGVGLAKLVGVAGRRHDVVVGIAIARAWTGSEVFRHAGRHDAHRLARVDAGQARGLRALGGIAPAAAGAAAALGPASGAPRGGGA